MKLQALGIGQFAIAGKLPAAFFFCPFLTGLQKFPGNTLLPGRLHYIDTFQITHGTAFRAFHIIMAQAALGEANGSIPLVGQKEGRIRICHAHGILGQRFIGCMMAAAASFGGGIGAILLMRFLSVKTGFSGFAFYGWGLGLVSFILYLMV